jgi:hypothetical protein
VQPAPVFDGEHGDAMQPDRIGPIGRTRREDAGQGIGRIRTRDHLQRLAIGLMQPGEQDDLLPHFQIPDRLDKLRPHLDACVRRALVALPRRAVTDRQRRMNPADRVQNERGIV